MVNILRHIKALERLLVTGFFLITICLFSSCINTEDLDNQKVKNIILMISNGNDLEQFQSMDIEKSRPNLSRATAIGKSTVLIADGSDTCLNSSIAVIAIGKKSKSQSLGLDSDGIAHPNMVELASVKGMATGMVTSGSALDATPASFIVHAIDKNHFETVAAEYLNSPIDLIIGGGLEYFTNRTDSANLIQIFKNKGYSVYNNISEVKESEKLIVLHSDEVRTDTESSSDKLLLDGTKLAINTLSPNPRGFFLMIDGSQKDSAKALNNQAGNNLNSSDFDKSIGIAFDFADKNPGTLVIITTDNKPDQGNTADEPNMRSSDNLNQLAKSKESSMHVYAYGTLANSFEGSYDNTEIFNKMVRLLKLEVE